MIMQIGSSKSELQEEVAAIVEFCHKENIKLCPEWIPREQNERAHYFSKLVDEDDWSLDSDIFSDLNRAWGPHTIDCFASFACKQLDRYCSRWWNPGCYAVDAFTISWSQENVWLVPPVHLIGRVIRKLMTTSPLRAMSPRTGLGQVFLRNHAMWWPKSPVEDDVLSSCLGSGYFETESDPTSRNMI